MKTRIIGSIFVLIVLVAVGILTGNLDTTSTTSTSQPEQTAPANPVSDNAFKDLKIN